MWKTPKNPPKRPHRKNTYPMSVSYTHLCNKKTTRICNMLHLCFPLFCSFSTSFLFNYINTFNLYYTVFKYKHKQSNVNNVLTCCHFLPIWEVYFWKPFVLEMSENTFIDILWPKSFSNCQLFLKMYVQIIFPCNGLTKL